MDSWIKKSSEAISAPPKPPEPYQVPPLRELALHALRLSPHKITNLGPSSIAAVMTILRTYTSGDLLAIETHTKWNVKEDPDWDCVWESLCSKVSLPKKENCSWRETWLASESKRDKYRSKSSCAPKQLEYTCMTPHQVDLMQAREAWRKRFNSGPPLEPPTRSKKKAKYK